MFITNSACLRAASIPLPADMGENYAYGCLHILNEAHFSNKQTITQWQKENLLDLTNRQINDPTLGTADFLESMGVSMDSYGIQHSLYDSTAFKFSRGSFKKTLAYLTGATHVSRRQRNLDSQSLMLTLSSVLNPESAFQNTGNALEFFIKQVFPKSPRLAALALTLQLQGPIWTRWTRLLNIPNSFEYSVLYNVSRYGVYLRNVEEGGRKSFFPYNVTKEGNPLISDSSDIDHPLAREVAKLDDLSMFFEANLSVGNHSEYLNINQYESLRFIVKRTGFAPFNL